MSILTLFPQVFLPFCEKSIVKRAIEKKLIRINIQDIRNFAKDSRKTVDDRPYGGGSGMVLKANVLVSAIESIKPKPYSILLSASGERFNQNKAVSYSKKKNIAFVCGHYEGIDHRVEKFVDEVVSIGDFVLTGGEVAAMAIVDSVVRLIPTVIKKESTQDESFSKVRNLLEYPQYTRPEVYRGLKVPKILLSGNHEEIAAWRQKEAVKRTKKYRPDLLKRGK